MPSREFSSMKIRLPAEMKEWLEAQARHYGSSQNSEVLRCIREQMDRSTVRSVHQSAGSDSGAAS